MSGRVLIVHIRMLRRGVWYLLLVIAAFTIGCRAANAVDLIETRQVIPDVVSSKVVKLVKPSVWTENGNTFIYGIVQRQAQVNTPLDGHVDVWVLSPNGQSTHLLATPTTMRIPIKGSRSQSFRARFNGIPPAGSTVRVAYRNRSHTADEVMAESSE